MDASILWDNQQQDESLLPSIIKISLCSSSSLSNTKTLTFNYNASISVNFEAVEHTVKMHLW